MPPGLYIPIFYFAKQFLGFCHITFSWQAILQCKDELKSLKSSCILAANKYNYYYKDNLCFPCFEQYFGRGFLFVIIMSHTFSHYKIIVAYDGSDFHGWQQQEPGICTVSGQLEKSFKQVFKEEISLSGASRTDAGVHARGQVASFSTHCSLPPSQLLEVWNRKLPPAIRICNMQPLSAPFRPRHGVVRKVYDYHIFLEKPHPLVARFGWICPFAHHVHQEKLHKIFQLYVGTHDFRSFCKIDPGQIVDTVRTVESVSLTYLRRWKTVRVRFVGPSFLRYQIRRMVGYALDVSRNNQLAYDYIKYLLDFPSAHQHLRKADASGLCLTRIQYEKDFSS